MAMEKIDFPPFVNTRVVAVIVVILHIFISSVEANTISNYEGYEIRTNANILMSVEKKSLRWPKLTVLNISNKNITKIAPHSFKNLTDIDLLVLNLTRGNLELEENSFAGLTKLIKLWFSCGVVHPQENLFRKLENLQSLSIYIDRSESLQVALSNIPYLQSLTIMNSNLGQVNIKDFANYSSTLTDLNLSGNNIMFIAPYAFSHLRNLIYLDLDSNELTDLLSQTFYALDKLQSLKISSNNLTSIGTNFFKHLKKLKKLDLRNNQIEKISFHAFSDLNISTLILTRNKLRILRDEPFHGLMQLRTLHLDSNLISIMEKNVFRGLRLSTLNLEDNNLSRVMNGTFSELTVEKLMLSNNKISGFDDVSTFKASIGDIFLDGEVLRSVGRF